MTARPDEVAIILQEMEACETLQALKDVRDKHRPYVQEIAKDPKLKVFAIHLANYASLRHGQLERGDV